MARKPKTRAPYIMVAAATWDLARSDYLNGMTAEATARKHGIGVANMRRKMAENGWTKRALAEARATPGPGGPEVTLPPTPTGMETGATALPVPAGPAAGAAAQGDAAGGDLLEGVLSRARAALTGGRGGEASALLKATREYVIMRQDIADARAANADGLAHWDEARPDEAGALTEEVTITTLHARWSRLGEVELAARADPTGKTGLVKWVKEMTEGSGTRRG